MSGLWIAELRISDAVATKISSRHRVTADEIREALICVPGLTYAHRDDTGCEIQIFLRGREHLAVIFPRHGADPDGVFFLATVYPR